ncbi:hypothetical protein JB92DRAFT_2838457 [Gautieria morchelliformis]|nr:hypothetical protein JB92DRAFT_2838457 [Gautieria morchelliformis]
MAESAADAECTEKPAVNVESTEKLAADMEYTEKLQILEDKSTNCQKEEAWIAAAEEPSAATEHANAETREFTQAQVEQTATNQTLETGFGLPLAPEGRTVSSLVCRSTATHPNFQDSQRVESLSSSVSYRASAAAHIDQWHGSN